MIQDAAARMIRINAATTSVCRRLAEFIAVSVKPADLRRVGVRYAGNAIRVEPRDAPIEEQQVGPRAPIVPRIDSFILAIVNPEAVENRRHPRRNGGDRAKFGLDRASGISRHAHEWVAVRPAGGPVYAVPAMDIKFGARALGGKRTRFGAFGIIPGRRRARENFRPA